MGERRALLVVDLEGALRATSAASAVLADAVQDVPGSPAFTRDATALFRLPGPPPHRPSPRTAEVDRALGAFLALTEGQDDETRALRALTLHMLEGHAPGAFARRGLGPTLEAAVAALAEVSLALPPGLPPEVGMSRVDAWYVLRERGLPHAPLEPYVLRAYLEHLDAEGHCLHAWLLGEMAASCGLDVRLSIPERALRGMSRLDLAAEVAFCLQCVGEAGGGAQEALLTLLAQHQQSDGSLGEASTGTCAEEGSAHATAGALLAFAGAEERHPFPE